MALVFPHFQPHPLIRGGHLQTIIGSYLPWRRVVYRATQHQVALPDGDAIVLHDDWPQPDANSRSSDSAAESSWRPGDPAVLLIHGLGGCHQSSYMQRCMVKLTQRGMRVFRMDLRGYGAGLALARHPLHAGRSEDAAAALAHIGKLCPDSPVHMVGFSIGANIVLKLAGEFGVNAPHSLASVMAVAPPIDLIECTRNIQQSANFLYDRRFLRSLLYHVERRKQLVPDAHFRPLAPRPRRLEDFDNQFTAPLSGFADARDYYTRSSSKLFLPHIAVPTLIVAAASDPIIPVAPFERASYSPTTHLLITPCGGHLGFVARPGIDPDRRWIDWRIIEWIESHRAGRGRPVVESPVDSTTESVSAAMG